MNAYEMTQQHAELAIWALRDRAEEEMRKARQARRAGDHANAKWHRDSSHGFEAAYRKLNREAASVNRKAENV